jgi:hypothetical protein
MALTRPLLSQLNTNIIAFSDNMMVINAGNIANRDLGIVFDRSVNSQSNVALFWQESSSSFTFAQTTSSGLNNANIVVGVTSNVVLGNIILAGNGAVGSTAGIFYSNGSAWGGGSGGTPGGNSGQIQYNNLGVFTGATNLSYSANGRVIANAGITSTSTATGTIVVTGGIGVSGNVYCGQVYSTNNGNGTNYAVGDDAWIGDVNLANTIGLKGQQDATQCYVIFGNSNAQTLGRNGTGALTYQGGFTAQGGLQSTPIGNAAASTGVFTSVSAATIGNTGSTLTGTIQTAAQTNITSVGNITAAGVTSSARIAPNANASVDLGATGLRWNNVYGVTFSGVATTAKYADLAEIYISDEDYPPGTVVVFGGSKEITTTIVTHDTRVAGVISTNPAYLMNSEVRGLPVALTGRVPCLVQGPVKKGDVLVTSTTPGTAQRINAVEFQPGCVVGKSLENIPDDELKLIEVVVGRF